MKNLEEHDHPHKSVIEVMEQRLNNVAYMPFEHLHAKKIKSIC